MNKHYLIALVAATVAALAKQEIFATEDDVRTVLGQHGEPTGNWDEDAANLLGHCLASVVDDELEPSLDGDRRVPAEATPLDGVVQQKDSVEERIDKVIGSLKIGYNFIPGIGAGWCRNEEDLEKMKDFVRGALTVQAMMPMCGMGGCGCDEED